MIDLAQEITLGISSNKVRSGLTILGIVIGIASVIAMLSVGQGAKAQIESSVKSLGSNLLMVMPGSQRGFGGAASSGRGSATTLKLGDATAIAELAGVLAVSPEVSKRLQVVVSGSNTNTQILGTTPDYLTTRNVAVASGSFFSDSDVTSKSKVAVIAPTTRDDLFGEGVDPVGSTVRINGMNFKIVGLTAEKGGSGMSNQDDMIFIPISTMQTFLSGSDAVSTIDVAAESEDVMTDVQDQITELLLQRHKISDATQADFSIMNQSDIVSAASSITGTFTTLLASIAGISLLVGGIGIMNMMLTTVTERTREIGLRQAIGAEKAVIVYQFLGEAILLTILGGLIGIACGWGIAKLITMFASTTTVVSWTSIVLAFGVSAGIGLVFGFYPARRAARLNPIEALRYE